MLLIFAIWLQNTGLGAFMRWSTLAYPIVLTLHLVCISLFGATLLVTDLRLLGWGMRGRAISSVVNQMRVPKRIGFVLVVTCGFLVFSSKAEEYYYNPFFRIKVLLLALVVLHALIFRGSVYSAPSSLDRPHPPASAKLAGGLSLLLWLCIAIAGRSIGYTHAPVGSHHYAGLTGPATRVIALHQADADVQMNTLGTWLGIEMNGRSENAIHSSRPFGTTQQTGPGFPAP